MQNENCKLARAKGLIAPVWAFCAFRSRAAQRRLFARGSQIHDFLSVRARATIFTGSLATGIRRRGIGPPLKETKTCLSTSWGSNHGLLLPGLVRRR